ncbi:MAG TPA: nucleoside hydrolase [Myxococcales bacterium]|jgi:purine nucleosidase|nr:nucleoside hydrolase [Myxococcales bacterium]
MRIWIDTDIGSDVDDALTLAYVLGHPGFELVGVSTVFGDVELRCEIAQALLALAGSPEIPVLPGLGAPLTPGRQGLMFGHEGLGILKAPRPRLRSNPEEDREARIARLGQAMQAARPEVVLAIGPLSNLGALVQAGQTLPPLAIMGGKLSDVRLPGMIEGISEWNWFSDAVAAQTVIGAHHATLPRVVPAEVTFRTALAEGDVERLAGGDALAQQLSVLCTHWLKFLSQHPGHEAPRVALHDPLTAAILVNPGLCTFADRRIRLDDRAVARDEKGAPNLNAATDVDNQALRDHLMETWL